jgi:hypothetical protein
MSNRLRQRHNTANELQIEQSMEQVIEDALATSPSAEDLAQVPCTCKSRIRTILKKLTLLLLKKVLG